MSGPTFFISAGEPSGDLHAARLVAALRRQSPEANFFGLGGPALADQGCRLIRDMTVHGSHMLLVEPLMQVGGYLKLVGEVDRQLEYRRPDVMIFVDYPGLNFVLASRGRVRCIPTLWYIPPQLWAWASFRVRKMARRLTSLACVFPFAVDFYRRHGIDARFVGHPLVDHFASLRMDAQVVASVRPKPGQKVVLLLPGSRQSEIATLTPLYLDLCRLIRAQIPQVRFVMGCLREAHGELARSILRRGPDVEVDIFTGKTNELMSVANLALAASGTATLELACLGTPMIAMYSVDWLQYQLLGRWLISTPFLSLPNALAGREIVPEFYLHWGGPEPIAEQAIDILTNDDRCERMREALAEVRRELGSPGASERAAECALALVGRRVPPVPWWRGSLHV